MDGHVQILIVDDESLIRLNLRALLEDLGFCVCEAADGCEALTMVEREAPDLILTDLCMPNMNGLALITALAGHYPDTPVIVVSGTGSISDAMEAVQRGAWDYVTKPVDDQNRFKIVIDRALERSRLVQENRRYHEQLEELVRERTQELHASETRYRRLLESITSYVYTTIFRDGKAVETVHQHGCDALTGFTPQEYAADPDLWFRMVYQEDRAQVLDMMQHIQDATEPVTFTHRLVAKNGDLRWVQSTLVPHRDNTGTLLSYDGIIADITDKKRLEEQLRQSQKMEAIGLLAGGIAHDFNNILTVIIGYESILKMHLKEDDPQQINVDHVLNAADRAAHLTSSLLAFSRKQEINPAVADLNGIIRTIEKFLKRVIGEDVTMQSRLAETPLNVFVDSGQIEQVLMNLATNARDAMSQGGDLIIETEAGEMDDAYIRSHGDGELGRYAVIKVTDHGVGMDEVTKSRLFEPFFTTKELGRGTGLGLAIVYGIIKQHNGYIYVDSEKGRGTCFTIYLPLHEATPETVKVPDNPLVGGAETILVADDDALIRELVEKVLTQFGYTLLTAGDGAEAVEIFRQNNQNISLVILDVIMPKMNGKEACNLIRNLRPDCRVLFMSGYPSDIVNQRGMLDQDVEFIGKPLTPPVLVKKVREVLDSK